MNAALVQIFLLIVSRFFLDEVISKERSEDLPNFSLNQYSHWNLEEQIGYQMNDTWQKKTKMELQFKVVHLETRVQVNTFKYGNNYT